VKWFYYIFVSFLFLAHGSIEAQETSDSKSVKIDSLNKIISGHNSSDTAIAAAFVLLSEEFIVSNPDTILKLCDNAIEISERNLKNKTLSNLEVISFRLSLANALNNQGYVLEKIIKKTMTKQILPLP